LYLRDNKRIIGNNKHIIIGIMATEAFRFSGEAAINYDTYLGPILFEPYAVDLVSRIVTTGVASVLEIACGTGRVTKYLRSHFGSVVKLVASDFSADMLEVAKNKLAGEAIEFRVEDAQQLSFADESFDLIVCQFGLMFFQDKKKALAEVMRVLKPGGLFIFNTWEKTDRVPLLKLIFNENLLPFFAPEPPDRFVVPFSLYDPHTLITWMHQAEFIDINIARVVLESRSPTPGEIVNAFFIKHSLGKEVLAKDAEGFGRMADNLEREIGQRFGHVDTRFELAAYLVTGRKAVQKAAREGGRLKS
jgi:SAM-dependent methyltransferase